MRNALAISHVAFEDLGSLADVLAEHAFAVQTLEATSVSWSGLNPLTADLVVVLGGPIGVYEAADYPFLQHEKEWLRMRLLADRPTLGICLGAQLMAAALGANVLKGRQGKEIGWSPLQAGSDVTRCPWMEPLLDDDVSVLHWHGDTFDLPQGALHLAGTEAYRQQAFATGKHGLGLQFHPEVTARGLERWYVGHACELANAGISVRTLRAESELCAARLYRSAIRFWRGWLTHVCPRASTSA